ncbi:MAG TPA: STAS domain-containing protein [Solirubrobacteraceae bacterium]|nr:STAS domain-containing protein [Solirubrobacteraceae bacterium]
MPDSAFPEETPAEQVFEPGELSIDSSRDGEVQTIGLGGELDLANAELVDRELRRVEATDVRRIVLDLAGLTFVDSSGIRLLIAAAGRADTDRLTIRRPPERIERVLRIAGVLERLPIAD